MLVEYINSSIEWLGDERKGIVHSRRHIAMSPVFKGIDNFKQTRVAMLRAESKTDLLDIINSIPDNFNVI